MDIGCKNLNLFCLLFSFSILTIRALLYCGRSGTQRYFYECPATGKRQWEFPESAAPESKQSNEDDEMDICTTPPHESAVQFQQIQPEVIPGTDAAAVSFESALAPAPPLPPPLPLESDESKPPLPPQLPPPDTFEAVEHHVPTRTEQVIGWSGVSVVSSFLTSRGVMT